MPLYTTNGEEEEDEDHEEASPVEVQDSKAGSSAFRFLIDLQEKRRLPKSAMSDVISGTSLLIKQLKEKVKV
jgi:hypothetical protein